MNKYNYLWVIKGNYGYGWEDLSTYKYYIEALMDLRAYRDNEKGTFRLIQRRELNAISATNPAP